MLTAWIKDGAVRDTCSGNPTTLFHPAIAALYTTEVPDGTVIGATQVEGVWTNPVIVRVHVEPTPVLPTIAEFDAALAAHLDATAQLRRYDNRITCALRAGYAGPFQAEGIAFAVWMDTCNAQAYELLAQVQSGTIPLPSSTQVLIDLLPVMVWP